MKMKDTFLCAKNSGDRLFLTWLRDRLTLVYSESPNVDFVWTVRSFEQYFERRASVPRWLDWLLKKFDL